MENKRALFTSLAFAGVLALSLALTKHASEGSVWRFRHYGNAANTIKFDIDNRPDSECKLPIATGSPHRCNKAEIGDITFPKTGLHLLTVYFPDGNNLTYFEFVPLQKSETPEAVETIRKRASSFVSPTRGPS